MRPFFSIRSTFIQISRARQVAEVLIRNGLGFLAESAGLVRYIPFWRARRMQAEERASRQTVPQRLRDTLQELGPTYIKLGQILSTRPDLLPADYILELSKLLDQTTPVPFESVREVAEEALGGRLEEHYDNFSSEPIASASIGQVHRATLPDGRRVIVKVQRPGVQEMVQADLNILNAQARFLESRSETLAAYGLTELVEEFSHALREELDYTNEGRNADRLRAVTDPARVVIPKVHWSLTTRRVITMDDVQGIELSRREELADAQVNEKQVAERMVQVYLRQVFVHGVFHADPHPANILVCGDRIGLVDFGMMGYLTPSMRHDLGDMLFALVQQDAEALARLITRMGATDALTDRHALERDLRRLMVRYYDVSLESLPMAEALGEIMSVAYRNRVRLPSNLALLARTVVVLEGVARSLDPSLVLARFLEPFIMRLIRERTSLWQTLLESVATLRDLEDMLHVLPGRIDVISDQIERGEMTLQVDIRHLGESLRRIEAVGNRLSFSVVVAALVIGSALVLSGGETAATFQIPLIGIGLPIGQIGFVVAGLLGAWWLFSIIRSKGL